MQTKSLLLLTLLLFLTPSVTPITPAHITRDFYPQDVTLADDAYHPTMLPRTEWWYFDAVLGNYTIQASVRIVTINRHGSVTTRLNLYKDGASIASTGTKDRFAHLTASQQTPDVSLDGIQLIHGTYNATTDTYDYTLAIGTVGFNATLNFTGRTKGWKILRPLGDGWAVMCPRADVAGTIHLKDLTLTLTGIGYHDHNWGLGTAKALRYGWYWGKINSDHYTLIWSEIETTRLTHTIIAVENTLDGGYQYIPQDNVWFAREERSLDHLHLIPYRFFISIQNPDQMSVFHLNVITIHYERFLGFIKYWRYHFHATGSFTFGITTELVDETSIGEFIRFH